MGELAMGEEEKRFHSVTLNKAMCKGCTTCIRHCPTQAIRVQQGKAKIISERCIDCGECIRRCQYHAKQAITDGFELLGNYKYNIALPAPAFCGQFSKADDFDIVLTGLKMLGFDHVFEVARGAEVITAKMRELIDNGKLKKPVISSACPATVRLIAVKYHDLTDHVAPLTSPMEAAAEMARKEAREKTGLPDEDIGVFFITPCPAKVTAIKRPIALERSNINGAISIKDVYMRLAHSIDKITKVEHLCEAGMSGVRWANHGGEANALGLERYIAVDGIANVIEVLEQLEDEKIKGIDFIETLACTGGCVGGCLTVENNFVANSRIRRISSGLEDKKGKVEDYMHLFWNKKIDYKPFTPLDDNLSIAMQKAIRMNEIFEGLPQLDCGSCGAPTCRELAEDIVRGKANETDCIFKLRERVSELAREMADLESKLPPSMNN